MAERPVVMVDPAVRFGWPHVKGISADAVGGMVWAGESVLVAADEYSLTVPEVLVACWFLGRHGEPRWRRRWRRWADQVQNELAHCRYEVPDPPDSAERGDGA